MSKIRVQDPQGKCPRGVKTYDNQTREIQQSQETTSRAQGYRVTGSRVLSRHGTGRHMNYGSCPHEGDGDSIMNMRQGCI